MSRLRLLLLCLACVASVSSSGAGVIVAPSPSPREALERAALARLLRRGGVWPDALAPALASLGGGAAVARVDPTSRLTLLHDALAGLHAATEAGPVKAEGQRRRRGSSSSRDDGGVALLNVLLAAGADPDAECPVTHALSYRQLRAARALLAAMSPAGLRGCVTERDAHEDTLLHAVVSSRAAGLARHVAATLAAEAAGEEGTRAASTAVGDALRRDAAALGLSCVPRRPSFVDVSGCLGADDVGMVLDAATGAGVDVTELLEARDAVGLTPLLRACQQGNAPAFDALVAAGANRSAVSRGAYGAPQRGAGRSCAHLAAGADAMRILRALPPALLAAPDEAGATPLDVALALGSSEAAAVLAAPAADAASAVAAWADEAAVVPPAQVVVEGAVGVSGARAVDAAGAGTALPRGARGRGGWRRGSASLRTALGADAPSCDVLVEFDASSGSRNGTAAAAAAAAFDALASAVLLQRPLVLRGLAADVRARATMTRDAMMRT